MKAKDWIIIILLLIIFFLLGFGVSYYFFNIKGSNAETKEVNKEEEKKEEVPEQKEEEPKKEESKKEEITYNFNETYAEEDLEGTLKGAGLKPSELKKVVAWNDESNKTGKSFSYNGKTVYVDCDLKLSTTKPGKCNSGGSFYLTIYEHNGYLFEYYSYPGTGGNLGIYDKNIKRLYEYEIGDGLFVVGENDVFFGVNKCEGKRTNGKKGEAVEVHRFNLNDGKDYVMFYMDHNAGWAC